MQKITLLSQKSFIYMTMAAGPLYLIKFVLFQIPFNGLEILILSNLAVWFWSLRSERKRLADLKKILRTLPWQLIIGSGLIFVGTFVSYASNNPTSVGLGILKGWFVLPFIFSFIAFSTLTKADEINKGLSSIYISCSLVAIISIAYKFLNITTYDGRLSALYQSPNYLAMYLAPGVLIGYHHIISHLKEKSSFFKKSLWIISSYWIILLAVFYTYSYASWISILLTIIIGSFFYLPKKHLPLFLTASFTLLFFIFASQLGNQKFISLVNFSQRSSLASRIMIWKASAKMLMENPIIGIGPGNFQEKYLAFQKYFPPYLEWAVPQPHNLFMAFWLQTGLAGMAGLLLLFTFILTFLTKKIIRNDFTVKPILFSFFFYTAIHGFFDTPFWKSDLSFMFWVFLGFIAILARNEKLTDAST